MKLGPRQFSEVSEGLTFEDGLFLEVGLSSGIWTSETRAIVCPRAFRTKPGFAAAAGRSARRLWPVQFRCTGGGAVPQGPGVLNLAIAFDTGPAFSAEIGYRVLTRAICKGLDLKKNVLAVGPTPGSFCDGKWNISIAGKKIVGTAQRWRPFDNVRTRVLCHALIMASGNVRSGAIAVNKFNGDLGLEPTSIEAHTTLDQALEPPTPLMTGLAEKIHRIAVDDFQKIQSDVHVAAA